MKKYLLLILLFSCQPAIDEELNFSEDKQVQTAKKDIKKDIPAEKLKLEPTIYFSYDSSSLSGKARKKLQNDLLWLQHNKKVKVVIEGHCDERGTREYNLALGDRRAYAVARFLINGGISSKRISVVSYGEERPAALGMSESKYRLNRRAEVKVR